MEGRKDGRTNENEMANLVLPFPPALAPTVMLTLISLVEGA